MNHLGLLLILAGALGSRGCEKREAAQTSPQPAQSNLATTSTKPKAAVKILANGDLFIDSQKGTIDAVDRGFAELARAKGIVWYHREAAQADPPLVASKVIELVIKHRSPISMSSKLDLSDTTDDKGVSHPRPR
jgi:hypothetical protein